MNVGHHEMIWRDVVEIARVNEDVAITQQTNRSVLLVVWKPERDIETTFGRHEITTVKAFDGDVTGLTDELFVVFNKRSASCEYFRYRELKDFVDR